MNIKIKNYNLLNILIFITQTVCSMHCGVERFNKKLLDYKINIINKDDRYHLLYYCKYINQLEIDRTLNCKIKRSWYYSLIDDTALIKFKEYTREEMDYYMKILHPCGCRTAKQANLQIKEIMINDTNKIINTDSIDMRNKNPTKFIYTFNNDDNCKLPLSISSIEIIDNSLFNNKKNTIFYARTALCLGVMISSGFFTTNPIVLLSATIFGGVFCPEIAKIGIDKYENQELFYASKFINNDNIF